MKQMRLMACMVVGFGVMHQGIAQAADDGDEHRFLFDKDRSEFLAPSDIKETHRRLLPQIEKAIFAHICRRKTLNWVFTSTRVQIATLQAIHAYNNLEDHERIAATDQLQMILDSHANFLYNPFFWNTRKHIALVDGFVYTTTGKRLDLSLLDNIPAHISGNRTPIVIARTVDRSRTKK